MSVVLQQLHDGILTVTINRPEARNALNDAVLSGLYEAFERADADREVRVVVLTGAGDKAFCAGGDLSKFLDPSGADSGQKDLFVRLFTKMYEMRKPILTRVQGACLAGGFGLALATDMVIASDNASFGTPEIKVGLWPMMISAILYRDMSRKRAHELMYTGRTLSAAEALDWGIINAAVPVSELDARVQSVAGELAQRSSAVLGLGRRALAQTMDLAYLEALRVLQDGLGQVLATNDAKEGMRAFFEKRTPNFNGS